MADLGQIPTPILIKDIQAQDNICEKIVAAFASEIYLNTADSAAIANKYRLTPVIESHSESAYNSWKKKRSRTTAGKMQWYLIEDQNSDTFESLKTIFWNVCKNKIITAKENLSTSNFKTYNVKIQYFSDGIADEVSFYLKAKRKYLNIFAMTDKSIILKFQLNPEAIENGMYALKLFGAYYDAVINQDNRAEGLDSSVILDKIRANFGLETVYNAESEWKLAGSERKWDLQQINGTTKEWKMSGIPNLAYNHNGFSELFLQKQIN
eukprot:314545_1